MEKQRIAAIVLAAGQGSRMGSSIQKQYIRVLDKPILYYSLCAFQKSLSIDEVILVVGAEDIAFCKKNIVEAFGFDKVKSIIKGGAERYDSVFAGLKAAENCQYILIHDGARPVLTQSMIETAVDGAKNYEACVLGCPIKDTIKIIDEKGYADSTPPRDSMWVVQTPQSFSYPLIRDAYEKLFQERPKRVQITDDAMVIEVMTETPVKLLMGDYKNIKVTTPEDLLLVEVFLKEIEEVLG